MPTPTAKSRDSMLGSIKRYYDTTYDSWTDNDLTSWLQEHGLAPKPKSTREELLSSVKSNWDSARSYINTGNNKAQKVFQSSQRSPLVDSWS